MLILRILFFHIPFFDIWTVYDNEKYGSTSLSLTKLLISKDFFGDTIYIDLFHLVMVHIHTNETYGVSQNPKTIIVSICDNNM